MSTRKNSQNGSQRCHATMRHWYGLLADVELYRQLRVLPTTQLFSNTVKKISLLCQVLRTVENRRFDQCVFSIVNVGQNICLSSGLIFLGITCFLIARVIPYLET